MQRSAQERQRQARLAAVFTVWIVLIVIASTLGDGMLWGFLLAAVGLVVGVYFGMRAWRSGRTQA